MKMVAFWRHFCVPYLRARYGNDQAGASLMEYALLLGLVAVACVAALTAIGNRTEPKFGTVRDAL